MNDTTTSGTAATVIAATANAAGWLVVAGLGPGADHWVTPEVTAALADATDVVGYIPYVARVAARPGLTLHASDNRVELDRAAHALRLAALRISTVIPVLPSFATKNIVAARTIILVLNIIFNRKRGGASDLKRINPSRIPVDIAAINVKGNAYNENCRT